MALFDNGVGFVTTSNFKPDDLYPDGLHRDRILPAIALLNEKLEVISVDNGTDYRRRTLEQVQALPHAQRRGGRQGDAPGLRAAGRERRREPGAAHRGARDPCAAQGRRRGLVRFQDACAAARARRTTTWRSRRQFHTVLLSDVPHMPVRMASEARRFTWLVDVFYDRRVKLIMSAEVPPEALYTEGPAGPRIPAHRVPAQRDAVGRVPGAGAPRRRHPPHMKKLVRLPADRPRPPRRCGRRATATTGTADFEAERARLAQERKAVEERFATEQAACYQKFAVEDCLEESRRRRRAGTDEHQAPGSGDERHRAQAPRRGRARQARAEEGGPARAGHAGGAARRR